MQMPAAKKDKKERKEKKKKKKEEEEKRPRKKLNTKACGKIITKDKSTQMRELNENGCPNQASKQLKPNSQMERMMKMMKKGQGDRGMEKKSITPTQQKPYMVTNSL